MECKDGVATAQHDEKAEIVIAGSHGVKVAQGLLGEPGVWQATIEEAQAASAHEHALSVRQALIKYPYAVLWSLCISMSIIMEGYDTILIGSLYAYPSYARQFGEPDSTGTNQIPAKWQSAMGSGPQAGAIIGAVANGFIIQRFGYRPAFLIGLILMATFVFVSFFGMSVQLQAVGQILCGYVYFHSSYSATLILFRLYSPENEFKLLILVLQCSMGYFCDYRPCLCVRTLPALSPIIFDSLHQRVFCNRPAYRSRSSPNIPQSKRQLGLAHTICCSMDLAAFPPDCRNFYARESLVACSKWTLCPS